MNYFQHPTEGIVCLLLFSSLILQPTFTLELQVTDAGKANTDLLEMQQVARC